MSVATCPKLRQSGRYDAGRYGVPVGSYVRPLLKPYMTFILERHADHGCLGYYREENGDQVPDPILWFQDVGNGDLTISTLETQLRTFCGAVRGHDGQVKITDPTAHAEMVEFAEEFVAEMAGRYLGQSARYVKAKVSL